MILIWAVFILGMLALTVVIWWKIFSKTGHPGALGLLMLVPIANLVMLLVLAFGEWPIHRELAHYRAAAGVGPGARPGEYR
ncbi:MAG: hypothetical protein JXP34_12605 [Planctomycetes bacterium]|nr:hypothetical protein [Planctomycetota bacterium]